MSKEIHANLAMSAVIKKDMRDYQDLMGQAAGMGVALIQAISAAAEVGLQLNAQKKKVDDGIGKLFILHGIKPEDVQNLDWDRDVITVKRG
jgi:hypothetical protein